MERRLFCVAAKLLSHKGGFTLVELLLVLTIVSLTIFLTVSYHKRLIQPMDLETQTTLLTSKIDYYQSLAIKKKQSVLLLFRPFHNDIKIVIGNQKPVFYSLKPLVLLNTSNLDYLHFNPDGNITKFGTLYFSYHAQKFALIFHIEQGRYRISLEN